MNTKDKFWGIVEFILWVLFTYTIIYSLKNTTSILLSSFIIVVLGYGAAIACPLLRQSKVFRQVYRR